MELVKKICSKAEFESILNKENVLCQFVSFLDAFNEHNFIYMVKKGKSYLPEVCEGYITYNESKLLSRDEIEKKKKEEFLREPFNDEVLYEVDTYPMFEDCIEYPIREVAFLTEDEMLKELVKLDNNSILNTFINKA